MANTIIFKTLKNILLGVLMLAVLWPASAFAAKGYSIDEIPNVQLADSTKLLSNPDGIIPAAQAAKIDSLLVGIRRSTTVEVAVVIVDRVDHHDDLEMYVTKLFNQWGIGKKDKDNGVLVLVVKDDHTTTMRTGRGIEGVLPDAITRRISDNYMNPEFKKGDFAAGVIAGVSEIQRLVSDPAAAQELRSRMAAEKKESEDAFFEIYAWICLFLTLILLIRFVFTVRKSDGKSDEDKYWVLRRQIVLMAVLSVFLLFMPLIILVIAIVMKNRLRNKTHVCKHCGTKMNKLSEEEDNRFLTMSQDLEERINSVDYDVWLCPKCNSTEIHRFENRDLGYHVCEHCGARTAQLSGTRVLVPATVSATGLGEKIYQCLHCNHSYTQTYTIPRKTPPVVVVGPGSGGGSGIGGGGGFGGGGFGGGLSGGGGSTTRW